MIIKTLAIINIYLIVLLLNMKLYTNVIEKSKEYIISLLLFILLMIFQSIIFIGIAGIILNL